MNYAKAKRALKRGHTIHIDHSRYKKLDYPGALVDFVVVYDGKTLRELLKKARLE